MSDERLRELERRYLETRSPEDEAQLVFELIRLGQRSERRALFDAVLHRQVGSALAVGVEFIHTPDEQRTWVERWLKAFAGPFLRHHGQLPTQSELGYAIYAFEDEHQAYAESAAAREAFLAADLSDFVAMPLRGREAFLRLRVSLELPGALLDELLAWPGGMALCDAELSWTLVHVEGEGFAYAPYFARPSSPAAS
ncbi:MAG TPA: hypothetical protein DEA08_27045 [Planctomycetes bacterium]|nr:hypothetical protein [Planctomycetota bacterium]